MTQEEKELLLKDLCGRLPYGVMIQEYNEEYGYSDNALNTIGIGYFSIHEACIEGTWINHIENVKPYLRPMSSMTEEERNEYESYLFTIKKDSRNCIYHTCKMVEVEETYNLIDWLNKKQFDYRGLITMGLALEAPKDMYKSE